MIIERPCCSVCTRIVEYSIFSTWIFRSARYAGLAPTEKPKGEPGALSHANWKYRQCADAGRLAAEGAVVVGRGRIDADAAVGPFRRRRDRKKLRIANFIGLSGPAGIWGPASTNSTLLAASEINRRGASWDVKSRSSSMMPGATSKMWSGPHPTWSPPATRTSSLDPTSARQGCASESRRGPDSLCLYAGL